MANVNDVAMYEEDALEEDEVLNLLWLRAKLKSKQRRRWSVRLLNKSMKQQGQLFPFMSALHLVCVDIASNLPLCVDCFYGVFIIAP